MKTIQIKKLGELPSRGIHNGLFVDVESKPGKDKSGKPINEMLVTVELEQKNSAGVNYRVQKTYNLDGYGPALFVRDYFDWSGRELTPEELNSFNADTHLIGQVVKLEIDYRKDGSEFVPVIKVFSPIIVETNG